VSALSDDPDSWPSRGNLFVDGFTYERIASGPTDAMSRLNWLDRQQTFKPQPYRQLAKALRELGDDNGQREVLVEMERRARTGELTSPFLRWTIGYGYHPLWALGWLGGLGVLGWIIFRRARLGIVPTDDNAYNAFKENASNPPAHYVRFSPAVYSLENSLPLVKLGQADRWQPDPNPPNPAPADPNWIIHLVELTASWKPRRGLNWPKSIVQRCLGVIAYISRETKSPVFLRRFLWFQILLGWILATLFAAGLAGLVHQ